MCYFNNSVYLGIVGRGENMSIKFDYGQKEIYKIVLNELRCGSDYDEIVSSFSEMVDNGCDTFEEMLEVMDMVELTATDAFNDFVKE